MNFLSKNWQDITIYIYIYIYEVSRKTIQIGEFIMTLIHNKFSYLDYVFLLSLYRF